VQEGFKYMFDERLVTVWSAPNYCYRCGNLASILTIRENGERDFTVFNAAEENQHDRNMQGARRMVSIDVTVLAVGSLVDVLMHRAACLILCNKGALGRVSSHFCSLEL
jgi:hypothetical protein